MTAPLCFLDTETDGVHPDRRVWEIGAIRRDPDGTQYAWSAYVEINLDTADPYGLQVGRFYDRHPLGRYLSGLDHEPPEPQDTYHGLGTYFTAHAAARQVARITHGAHLVGCVPNFDSEALSGFLRDNLLLPAWHHHLIDVEALAIGWLTGRGRLDAPAPPWRSDDLSRACGVEPPGDDDRHTALGDARWAMRWYDAIRSPRCTCNEHDSTDPLEHDDDCPIWTTYKHATMQRLAPKAA